MHAGLGLHDAAATDREQATPSQGDIIGINAESGLKGASGLELEHDGRQLTIFTAAPQLFKAGSRVLNTFLGAGAGALMDSRGIAGSGALPTDLRDLIDDAIKEIDATAADSLTKVRTYHDQQSCTRSRIDITAARKSFFDDFYCSWWPFFLPSFVSH